MWGAVFACLLHHSLCRCHMCWIELFTPPPPPHRGSQHTPVFRYLRQTCLVSPKQSSLSFHTLVPKVLEVYYQTTTISKHLPVSNWVKAFFNFRYGEPSWRSNNAHAILRCQGNTIIHTVHVMNACAPRSLTSCNERINDKHTILVEITPARLDRTHSHTHMRDSGYVLMLFIDTQLSRNAVVISMPRSNSAVSKERWGKKHNFQNHFSDVL